PAPALLEVVDAAGNGGKFGIVAIALRIDPRDDANNGGVATEHIFHGLADFAQRSAGAGGGHCGVKQIALIHGRKLAQGGEHGLAFGLVAAGAHASQQRDLLDTHLGVVDIADVNAVLDIKPVAVDADNDIFAAINTRLPQRSGLFDFKLGTTGLHRLGHAALGL